MFPPRVLIVVNVSLSLIAVLLFLHLLDVELPSLGRTLDFFNSEQPLCTVNWQGEQGELPLDPCCLEARKQLDCHPEGSSWVCETGSSHALRYVLNSKAYYYCQQQVIWK